MCGRYNFSAEEAAEIRKIIQEVQQRVDVHVKTGEVYPTNLAAVLTPGYDRPQATAMVWGFPHYGAKSGVIINARAETVHEKRMFRDSVLARRCLIPSTGFYEWGKEEDGSKTKLLFREPESAVLYMAGFWNTFKDKDGAEQQRFVILTTAANESMLWRGSAPSLFPGEERPIHSRMPVVLRPEERELWLREDVEFDRLFDRRGVVLEHRIE